MKCECSDSGCSVHEGTSKCAGHADVTLYRVDMEDRTGSDFCDACAEDAMGSGLFADQDEHDAGLEDEESDGPDEDAITTEDHRSFFQYGRRVLWIESRWNGAGDPVESWYMSEKGGRYGDPLEGIDADDHVGAVRAFMNAAQFWPDVYWISDHGNAHLLTLSPEGTVSP